MISGMVLVLPKAVIELFSAKFLCRASRLSRARFSQLEGILHAHASIWAVEAQADHPLLVGAVVD